MSRERHDILPRIIALLLSLALLAERAASGPLAVRLRMGQVCLLAQYGALTLVDFPDDDGMMQTLLETPDFSGAGYGVDTLIHLAMVFRAVAAVLMHACLTSGMPRSERPNHAITLSLNLASRPTPRRFTNGIGFVHDTS